MTASSLGNVRQRASGRWQARWQRGGKTYIARTEDGHPLTFATAKEATRWLNRHEELIRSGEWSAKPKPSAKTLRDYAPSWLETRSLELTTRDHYRQILRDHVFGKLGDLPLPEITPATVRDWHAKLKTGPTQKAHSYGLLKSILKTAVEDDEIAANPCRIRAGGSAKTAKKMRPATLEELATITAAMPERYRMMVQLATWASLRFGELAELRRKDVDLDAGLLRIRRGVVRTSEGPIAKAPKSEAGKRDVTIPPHIRDGLADHLERFTATGRDGLLFPAADGKSWLAPSSLFRHWYPARSAAGREDLRFHDLRHTGQTFAAHSGANLRELMQRAGQSTSGAALRYIHAVDTRQAEIAERLSAYAATGSQPLRLVK